MGKSLFSGLAKIYTDQKGRNHEIIRQIGEKRQFAIVQFALNLLAKFSRLGNST